MMENETMSREEMCMMLCNMGYNMEELEMCSNNELKQMCRDKMNGDGMMEMNSSPSKIKLSTTNFTSFEKDMKDMLNKTANMSSKEMRMMLSNMGHKMEELERLSSSELKKMCIDKMKMDMIEKNKKKMHMMSESSRIIKSWKNFK